MAMHGLSYAEGARNFWVVDVAGLLTAARPEVAPMLRPFSRPEGGPLLEGASLLEVVKTVQPDILIGLAGAGRLFTRDVVTAMGQACQRPVIFAMSNPTSKMECTAETAQHYTEGRAIFASGSPQADVNYQGRNLAASQANNVYIFPGLALGAFLGEVRQISDSMIQAAAMVLPDFLTDEDIESGKVYPDISKIREISFNVARTVAKQAAAEGRLRGEALRKLNQGEAQLSTWIGKHMYLPEYQSLVHLPVGVNE